MKYTFIEQDGEGCKVQVDLDHVVATDILDRFMSFMLACTYSKETVLDAMAEILDRERYYDQSEVDSAGRELPADGVRSR